MLDLSLMTKMHTRPPPTEELIASWKQFFAYKQKKGLVVNNIQAKHVLTTFRHLQKNPDAPGLDSEDLTLARDVLRAIPSDGLEEHAILATELYTELQKRDPTPFLTRLNMDAYVSVLVKTGHSLEARDLLSTIPTTENVMGFLRKLYYKVLMGLAKEGKEAELIETCAMSENHGIGYTWWQRDILSTFYAEQNNVKATKLWWRKQLDTSKPSPNDAGSPKSLTAILKFCIRNDELDWCRDVFREALNQNPRKDIWDVILQWAAGTMGKGVEDVEQMLKIMEERSTEEVRTAPDSETINGLVEMCMENTDPYTAERYIELGRKFGIQPNVKTFILQLNYRADHGDLAGAQAAYEALLSEEVLKDEDLPAVNKYVRALCTAHINNYTRIRSIMADLEERNVRLEAETTCSLSMMYMEREELHDALDVLQANSWHYTLAERDNIRESFTQFCLNEKNSTARVWDAYSIMREVVNEADRNVRTKIMNEFFRRGRCDMACYTFGHMRQNIDVTIRPTADTYVECLQGIAYLEDVEHLDMVHNMLKMDSSIEPSTRLYNALMLAYAECDDPDRAVEFWEDITNSSEGPTYNSLVVLFRACELKPFAEKLAMQVWDKMKRMDIEVTRDVLQSYLAALAGRGIMEEGKRLVEGMDRNYGFKVDVLT